MTLIYTQLKDAVYAGDLATVKNFIASHHEDRELLQKIFWLAAVEGQTDIVETLIPLVDPKDNDSKALRDAARHEHMECVALLIPFSDPKAQHSEALRWAVLNSHEEMTRLLLPVSDATTDNASLLQDAAYHYSKNKAGQKIFHLIRAASQPREAALELLRKKEFQALDLLSEWLEDNELFSIPKGVLENMPNTKALFITKHMEQDLNKVISIHGQDSPIRRVRL